MTMNRIIPIIGGIILLMALAVVFKSQHQKPKPDMLSDLPKPPAPDADTPADTVRSLSAKVASLVEETKKLTEENRRLREQNREYRIQEERIVTKIRSKLSSDIERASRRDDSALTSLQAEIDRLRNRISEVGSRALKLPDSRSRIPSDAGEVEMPVGFGFGEEGRPIHWVEPMDAVVTGGPGSVGSRLASNMGKRTRKNSGSLLHDAAPRSDAADAADQGPLSSYPIRKNKRRGTARGGNNTEAARPVYTIPANSTLIDSTAFSALVGRVPVGGQVQDPMPFKVLIGSNNLAANGHYIPGLQGIVMSGYAVGDWTLSCVRGYITSALFVFDDGHIQVFGEKKAGQARKGKGEDQIGWISDEFGVPCISGSKVTNAPAYLTQRIGIKAMEAAAEAAAAAQTTTWSSSVYGGGSTTVDGDQTTFILGKTVSDATDEIGTWLEERQANSFDAIFAPAGTRVAVHLDVTLPIDHDPAGRMLDHRAALAGHGGAHGYLD